MTYLISLETLKKNYSFDENLSDKYILPIIQKGQDFIIRKVLGTTKFNQLLVDTENKSVSDDDKILINQYIHPVLAYYCLSEVIFATAYKVKNNPDYQNQQSIDRFNELIKISNKYLIDSQTYETILREYICDNNIILSTEDSPVLKSGYKTKISLV